MPAALRWFLRLGPTNPVAVRLVHNGSRRRRHLLIRTGYLAALIAVLLWSLLLAASAGGGGALSYRNLAAAGSQSFIVTAYLQIGLICVLAPLFMAGAIAQEANPRTWDILLTTPLSATQIVLGNLLGRLFFILALLFSSLPLFAVTQYFGGVPGRTIFASYGVAACAALLVGAIAIAMSVSRLAGRRAVFTFYICVVSYIGLTFAIDSLLSPSYGGGVTPATALNPFLAQKALLNPSSYAVPDATALASMGAISRLWLGSPVVAWCLWSSLLSVSLCVAGAVSVRVLSASGVSLRRVVSGNGERRARPRALRGVWKNPIAWREAAARASTLPKRIAKWAFLGMGLIWAVGIVFAHHGGRLSGVDFRFFLAATVWTELGVVTLIAMNMAATAVSREREDGTLDLLLTTPITPRQYLLGKLRGLISFLAPMIAIPVLTIAIAAMYVAGDGFGASAGVTLPPPFGVTVSPPLVLPIGAIVTPLVVVPFIAFCVMVGLQWSLKSKGTIGSAVATVGVVTAVGGVLGLCGWNAAPSISFAGPAIACLNPASALFVILSPVEGAMETVKSTGSLQSVSTALLVGSLLAICVYGVVVWGMLTSMVRSFDMTVRRLAGTK